jgi:drug/metabolite transporter (DMT)-like permease
MKSSLPVIFALLTGLFWGSYGPVLGQARSFEKSPFKPYVMIGIAYLVWGILGGLVGMASKGDSFTFTKQGTMWGFAAGTLGAWGALTLTLAMYTGGTAMPQVVMPVVFGTAVTISAIIAVLTTKTQADPRLWLGIIGMGICIITVAYYTPHQVPHSTKPAEPPAIKDPV